MSKKVEEAQKAIAKILAQLEIETGSLVEEIGIEDINLTLLNDPYPTRRMIVRIKMKRTPGHNW